VIFSKGDVMSMQQQPVDPYAPPRRHSALPTRSDTGLALLLIGGLLLALLVAFVIFAVVANVQAG